MKLITKSLIPAVLLTMVSTAPAAVLNFGTTLGSTTFHRPTGDEFPFTPGEAELSPLGDSWSFSSIRFIVDQTDSYGVGVTSNGFDIFLALYSSFDPMDPVSNLIALLDDGDGPSAQFDNLELSSGTEYTLVVTSFWDNTNGDLTGNAPNGSFSGNFTGAGNITVVPEPASSLLGCFGALVLMRRRRSA